MVSTTVAAAPVAAAPVAIKLTEPAPVIAPVSQKPIVKKKETYKPPVMMTPPLAPVAKSKVEDAFTVTI